MRYGNLIITNKDGEETMVEYAFPDDGKVFADKDGNTFSSIERERVGAFTEVDFVEYDEVSAEEIAAAIQEAIA